MEGKKERDDGIKKEIAPDSSNPITHCSFLYPGEYYPVSVTTIQSCPAGFGRIRQVHEAGIGSGIAIEPGDGGEYNGEPVTAKAFLKTLSQGHLTTRSFL
jgi:hypothetical protein